MFHKTVLIGLNTSWNLINYRIGLVKCLLDNGYKVICVAPKDKYSSKIRELGCIFIPLSIDNKGTNPVKDVILFFRYVYVFLKCKPDIFLGYTIKPNVYGSLAAHLFKVPVVNNIAGLGAVFSRQTFLAAFVKKLYFISLFSSYKVFFQNKNDCKEFVSSGLLKPGIVSVLPGSGIDLDKFSFSSLSLLPRRPFRFLLVSRLLWEKGIGEYVAAAYMLREMFSDVECCLLGFVDVNNAAAVPQKNLDVWIDEGVIKYLGVSDDVRNEIGQAHSLVLPSYYREGTPRVLLEASAMGRPIITTDMNGCRDVVEDEKNGFLCQPRSVDDLMVKMTRMLELSEEERQHMGEYGRKKMEREYDEKIVIDAYLQTIREINN